MPPPRKTAAVTIAGVLLLLPAAACALIAIIATDGHFRDAFFSGVFLIAAAFFGYAGLAIIRRWRGWRIWAGTIAWGLIALVVLNLLNLFKTPPPPDLRSFTLATQLVLLAFLAIAVFVLIAKRRELKTDLRAVFD